MLALVVFGLMPCTAPAPACAEGSLAEVAIVEYQFKPAAITVKTGDRVRWTNREKRTSHSVFFSAEGLPESDRLFPGETWERSFLKPCDYPYACGPHPEMKGVVHVTE